MSKPWHEAAVNRGGLHPTVPGDTREGRWGTLSRVEGLRPVGHGGMVKATGAPRSSWLRKFRADRPCCQHVCHTDISTDCARAPAQVRLPPQILRRMTPKRIA